MYATSPLHLQSGDNTGAMHQFRRARVPARGGGGVWRRAAGPARGRSPPRARPGQ